MAEREVNMRRITKRRLSSLLCAVLMLITSIDVAAFAAGSDASKRKIDVWDMGAVQEADTSKYNNNITASDIQRVVCITVMVQEERQEEMLPLTM